jgi:hypothetical protein
MACEVYRPNFKNTFLTGLSLCSLGFALPQMGKKPKMVGESIRSTVNPDGNQGWEPVISMFVLFDDVSF